MTPIALLALASLTVQYQPAQPRVGDPVTLRYSLSAGERVEIADDPGFEVVSRGVDSVVVRSFRPGPFVVQGNVIRSDSRLGFTGPVIKVTSILGPTDDLKPAAPVPPKPIASSPFLRPALIGAAVFAALAWLALLLWGRLQRPGSDRVLASPRDFESFLRSLRGRPLTQTDIAALADATRLYLGAGSEKTTSEVLAGLSAGSLGIPAGTILRQGDLAKFSPWGSPAAGSEELLAVAETLMKAKAGDDQAG